MFRDMRRKKQKLSYEECERILKRNTAGVLAVDGDNNYPYAVPMSYVYDSSKIYFHCAKTGHKIDAITKNEKVSFCVIDEDRIVPEEYTTYYVRQEMEDEFGNILHHFQSQQDTKLEE